MGCSRILTFWRNIVSGCFIKGASLVHSAGFFPSVGIKTVAQGSETFPSCGLTQARDTVVFLWVSCCDGNR